MCMLSFLRSSTLELRNQPQACFPTNFFESLLARFAIFPTPAGCPCRWCYCSALLFFLSPVYLPPLIRRLHRGAPFLRETCSWQKIDREDRATGKSRVLSISRSLHPWLFRAYYTPVITIRPLPVHLIFFFLPLYIDITENADSDGKEEGSRGTRQENRMGAVCFFAPRFLLCASFHFFMFSLSVRG